MNLSFAQSRQNHVKCSFSFTEFLLAADFQNHSYAFSVRLRLYTVLRIKLFSISGHLHHLFGFHRTPLPDLRLMLVNTVLPNPMPQNMRLYPDFFKRNGSHIFRTKIGVDAKLKRRCCDEQRLSLLPYRRWFTALFSSRRQFQQKLKFNR